MTMPTLLPLWAPMADPILFCWRLWPNAHDLSSTQLGRSAARCACLLLSPSVAQSALDRPESNGAELVPYIIQSIYLLGGV